ncbi:PREDICTED: UPF0496 protein At2g18630 [Prunus mume]|uniref:UPF0496 protein At2g18630 n=1 Tax=Prunus mume TaxID=102107 RepID=A0ABM0PM82_PRUMU|nr:PREDICTED: UPF0496 protein At2g18630 [Prunus mume]
MMGAKSSKNKGVDGQAQSSSPPPPQSLEINTNSQDTADLSSYEAACKHDPALQSFDATLRQRTSRVITSLSTGLEVRSLSLDSLKEVTDCLLEMNQEVVKVILECKKDIWNSKEMFSLVEEYFENSLQTMDFCTALEQCLKRALNNQLIIQAAVRQFQEEVEAGAEGKRCERTLQELRAFKAAGEPFTDEFFILFQSVYKQQASMFEKLQLRKRKLDKKLKSVKAWRRVSNVIFVAGFVSVLVFSVVAAAIAAPPLVTALAGALAVPIGSIGKWCNLLWNRYERTLKGQREIISSMQIGTYVTMKDLDNIRVLVDKWEIQIESLLQTAGFALREEDTVKLVIDEIKKKLEMFVETIDNLSQHADKCSRNIRRARTVILQRIIRHPDK